MREGAFQKLLSHKVLNLDCRGHSDWFKKEPRAIKPLAQIETEERVASLLSVLISRLHFDA